MYFRNGMQRNIWDEMELVLALSVGLKGCQSQNGRNGICVGLSGMKGKEYFCRAVL
jgi:hypothetical protein